MVLRKLHGSIFIAWLSVGVLGGVAGSLYSQEQFISQSWLVLGLILVTTVFIWRRAWMIGLVVVAGMVLGLWRGDQLLGELRGYQPNQGKTIELSAVISEDTTLGRHGDTQLELRNIELETHKLPGTVWASVRTTQKLQRSDRVVVSGVLKEGFGNFAASINGGKVEDRVAGSDAARDFRDWFASGVRRALSEPEASLGIGYLVGQRSSLPPELDTQLQMVGLTHIVVASGYNLTILVRLARKLLSGISKYLMAATSLGMIGGFILVTGLSPSMSRAGLVAVLSLGAWYYGRKISPFILLPFAAAITLLVNPSFAWGDVGWYLSFAAFGGVMIVAPLLHHYFFGITKPGFIRQVLGETLAAVLVTAPIIMLVFEQYSPYALLSNLLVVPLIPYIMLAVFGAGIASWLLPFAAEVISLPASGLLQYVTSVTQWIASFPHAQTDASLSPLGLAAYYVALVIIGTYLWFKTRHNFREDNIIE